MPGDGQSIQLEPPHKNTDQVTRREAPLEVRPSFRKMLFGDDRIGSYISSVQRNSMTTTLEMGHAAMHRAFSPEEGD
jgi:hypothetical protein